MAETGIFPPIPWKKPGRRCIDVGGYSAELLTHIQRGLMRLGVM